MCIHEVNREDKKYQPIHNKFATEEDKGGLLDKEDDTHLVQ